MSAVNAWAARFEPLLDESEIRRRATVRGHRVPGVRDVPPGVAAHLLKVALEAIYIPSDSELDILRLLAEEAYAHSLWWYPDRAGFVANCYLPQSPLRPSLPYCLTGPAGVGKTKLLEALKRLLPPDADMSGHGFTEGPVISMWYCPIQSSCSLGEMLARFPTYAEDRRAPGKRCCIQLARLAYRLGIGLMALDEMQFMTQSQTSNTRVAQAIQQFAFFGPPMVYACNYSLGHRLLRRPLEERQRMLARPLVLLPDLPADPSFVDLLAEFRAVAPDVFAFDPERDAAAIHQCSAGLRRLVVDLLVIAAESALRAKGGSLVDVQQLLQAYRSTRFTANRRDVEAMHVQEATGKSEREDLSCPFDLPAEKIASAPASSTRAKEVRDAMLLSAMTPDQRADLRRLQSEPGVAPVSRSRPRRTPATAAELLANLSRVEEALPRVKKR
jgi:energy-coupling factor transporter ATP-binding protein EcfA2